MKPLSPEWKARVAAMLAEEAGQPERYWYLSFAGPKFLGGCFVLAHGRTHALRRTHELGINPGGEVMAWRLEGDCPPGFPLDTLLSKEQMGDGDVFHGYSDAELTDPTDP